MIKIKVQREKFIERRIKAGFTQRGLGRAAKPPISSGYLSLIENGDCDPSPDIARRICEALGAEFDELFYLLNEDDQAAAIG